MHLTGILFLSENVELSWKLWNKQFMSIVAQSIPNSVIPMRRNLPWLNKFIVKLIEEAEAALQKGQKDWKLSSV